MGKDRIFFGTEADIVFVAGKLLFENGIPVLSFLILEICLLYFLEWLSVESGSLCVHKIV